jgi:hypothetical protein
MRPVGGVRGPSEVLRIDPREVPADAPAPAAGRATALIPVAATTSGRDERDWPAASQRPSAGFLAHMIATVAQLPQTRERRRAEPGDAIAAYRSMVNGSRVPTSRQFSRST